MHKVFLQIFPKVTLFSRNCVLPSIPEMPQKQNKRTPKAEKKVRVNDREDMPCEPVVGASRKKIEMMGAADRVADGMEQSSIIAHVFQWLVCWLMFRAPLMEKPDCTFQCVRDRIRGLDSHQSLLWLVIFGSTRNLKCCLHERSSVTRRM